MAIQVLHCSRSVRTRRVLSSSRVCRLIGQSQSEVPAILSGRRLSAYDMLERASASLAS